MGGDGFVDRCGRTFKGVLHPYRLISNISPVHCCEKNVYVYRRRFRVDHSDIAWVITALILASSKALKKDVRKVVSTSEYQKPDLLIPVLRGDTSVCSELERVVFVIAHQRIALVLKILFRSLENGYTRGRESFDWQQRKMSRKWA